MKRPKQLLLFFFMMLTVLQTGFAQFTVSSDKRFLQKDGKPFFWMGDTAWELFHRLNREEADRYLKRRSEQGFTVIQAVALAELDGLHTPNPYGETPLINNNPATPNEKYFQHVDYVISKADEYGLNIGLLPTWGDKLHKDSWGKGPEVFNVQNAATYAVWLANRYKNRKNVIWILGGDRNPKNDGHIAVWRSMGNSIKKATDGKAMITFHPQPNEQGSAEWFHRELWLDFNMFQTGHCRDNNVYDKINAVYNLTPVKPVMDGEPIYEDHPVCFNVKDLGTSNAFDVRKAVYLDLFAGAFGHTYGCHDIWQMYSPKNEGVNGPHLFWYNALELPGANQMIHVRRLMESRAFNERVPDQTLVVENNYTPAERIQCTRGKDYAMVYSAAGKPFHVNLGNLNSNVFSAAWYNPRDGKTEKLGDVSGGATKQFIPPSSGYGKDWILVLDVKKQ